VLEGAGQSAEIEGATPRTVHKVPFGYCHFQDFREMKVENVDGQKIGTINDFIMEVTSGRPVYVVLKSGGFSVGHRRMVIVPASEIAFRTAKVGIAALNLTKDQWKRAPEFSRKDLESLANPEKARLIAQFYKLAEEGPSTSAAIGEQEANLASTGRAHQPVSPRGPKRYELANDLVGSQVLGRGQMSIGKISDVLVDFSGAKPAFAILSAEHISASGASFAVPVRLLARLPDRSVVLNAGRQDFEKAKPFRDGDTQNLVRSEGNEIFRYER